MKRLKILICLFVLQVFMVIPSLSLFGETPVSTGMQTDDRENDNKVESIIKKVREFRKAGKFEEALKQLNIALDKFPQKEYREKLQIERADVHILWAHSLKKKYDYANAIKHFEMAYAIDKDYNPKYAATHLNNIGFLYSVLGQKQKALEYYEKALPIHKAMGNRPGEATTLNNIGLVYDDLGQKQRALEFYQKALPIRKEVGDRAGEATTLNNIGAVYDNLGQKQKALEFYQKALPIRKEVGDRAGEATTLNNIGAVYSALGQKQKALEFYEKALPIYQSVGHRAGEATTLNNIGGVYSTLGQKQKALEFYQKVLSIVKAVGNLTWEAKTLNNIGGVYVDLGQKQKALEFFQEALPIFKKVGNRAGKAATLNNIGAVYDDLGQKQKALAFYQEALPIYQEVGDLARKATTLNNIGVLYVDLGQKQKALAFYQKALPIRKEVGDRAGEATTLNNIGLVYSALGQKQKALGFYQKALPIRKEVEDRAGEATTLKNLMFCWESLKNTQFSIFYGKLSVNAYQNLRTNISALDKEIKRSYLETMKNTYRYLANLLIDTGRIPEAQQVLDMLKEEEFFQFIRRDRSYTSPTYNQLDFNEFERQWFEKYNKVTKNLSELTGEYYLLKNKTIKNDNEKKRMEELEAIIEKFRKAYHEYLIQLKKAFSEHDEDIKKGKYEALTLAEHAMALQSTLRHLDKMEEGKNAVLHYMVYEGRVTVILTTPHSQMVKVTTIDEKKLNRMIIKYREVVRELKSQGEGTKTSTANAIQKDLYDMVFKSVDEELKKYGATNLMIFLNGVLRYIPLTTLWDGETYLVQRYRMTLFTTSSLTRIELKPDDKKKILGLGASSGGSGFLPLPNVKEEIRLIVKDKDKGFNGLINGKAFLDNDFTKDTFVNQLKTEAFPLVHISSHFKFSPGDETKNYLLLGDGSMMNLAEIRHKGNIFHNVELLMLAACETAIGGGNGFEIDGFGELAQQSGAKTVVASLWKVRDESTKDLMVNFYRILKEGKVTSKIEALRQAQLQLAGLDDLLGKNNPTVKRKRTKYAHPYYWGPFIMIGNWR
jgi:CHAT domain-containing protein/Tfp pilus assembly protein PilF